MPNISIKIVEKLDVVGELMLSSVIIDESLLEMDIGIGKRMRDEGCPVIVNEISKEEIKGYVAGALTLSTEKIEGAIDAYRGCLCIAEPALY